MKTVYSFAGCVMEGAPFLSPFAPGTETSTRGMSTEGVLRLLSGESLAIEECQLAQLRAKNHRLPDEYGRYNPVHADRLDTILWTPVSDAVYLIPLARCPDKTVYPIHDAYLNETLGSTGASLSYETMSALWARLYETTAGIDRRGVVFYPTDHLIDGPWKRRIDTIQRQAHIAFSAWKPFTVEPDLAEPGGYWAHYSEAARQKLWGEVAEWL